MATSNTGDSPGVTTVNPFGGLVVNRPTFNPRRLVQLPSLALFITAEFKHGPT